jgi:competence protein ComEA
VRCAALRDTVLQDTVLQEWAAMSRGAAKLLRGNNPARACASLQMAFLLFAALGFAAMTQGKKTPPATPVDLNTASAEELAQLPGIGPGAARAIVQFREKSGPFQRVDDLLAIRGITQRKLAQIKPYVKVTPNAPAKSAKPGKP